MASPKYPATNNAEAIELNIFNANQFFTVLQGDIDDTIPTYEGLGDIPSVAKALNEAAAYKVPLAWETTGEATDLMQPYEYDGNVYVPISVPAPFSTAPSVDHWRLYSEKNPKVTADTLHFTGDDVTTEFNVPSAVINDPAAYLVSINGVVQRPTIDYDISVSTDTLTFVEAPPAPSSGANNISVTILGNFVGALSERIYSSVSEGLAQTPAGQFFQVKGADSSEIYVDLYKNDSGIAQKIDSYPNKFALDNAITALESAEATTSMVLDQVITRSGYTIAGDYAAGITINSYSDLILKDGLYYHLGPAISLPYVTTGVWLDEEDNFRTISLGDLRQQLASTAPGEGASLISMEGGPSVEQAVTDVEQAVNERVIRVSSRTEMKAYDVPAGTQFSLEEGRRSGLFVVKTGTPPSDPQEGIYVVLANGNYAQRQYGQAVSIDPQVKPTWFGLDPSNTPSQNSTAINEAAKFAKTLFILNGVYNHSGFSVGTVGSGFTIIGEDQIATRLNYIGSSVAITAANVVLLIKNISIYGDNSGANYWTTGSTMLRNDGVVNMEYVNCRYWDKIWDWNGGYYHKITTCQFLFFNEFSTNINGNNFVMDACRMASFNNGPGINSGTGNFSFINGSIEAWSGDAIRDLSGASCVFNVSNNYVENYPSTSADRGLAARVSAFIVRKTKGGVIFENNNIQTKGIRRGVFFAWAGTGDYGWLKASGNKWITTADANNDLEYAYFIMGSGTEGVSNIEINDPKSIASETGHTQSYPLLFLETNYSQVEYARGFNAFTGDRIYKPNMEISLLNGWTNETNDATTNTYPLSYSKSYDGYVNVRGVVDGGSSTDLVIANLPSGYRPSNYFYQTTSTKSGTVGVIRVLPNGDIRAESPSTPNDLIINLWFRADGS